MKNLSQNHTPEPAYDLIAHAERNAQQVEVDLMKTLQCGIPLKKPNTPHSNNVCGLLATK